MTEQLNHHAALIYVMVTMSAVDRTMTDAELSRIGEIVSNLPVFDDFDQDNLVKTAEAATGVPSRNNWGPLVVPKDEYFVLGDNRDNSLDSRYWQFVPDSLIRGRPMFVYYSYDPDSLDRMSWLTRIRWTRIGERVR